MLDFTIKKNNDTGEEWLETSLAGKALLTIPQLNKGTAFTKEERQWFNLTGKLPVPVETLDQQIARAYLIYQSYNTDLQKNFYLNKLHDTNQVLFYKLMENHEAEMIPIVYTPTVGAAVEKFSRQFQQARGLYITYEHRHEIETILDNRSNPELDVIVVSDGGGVLGIGDQGVGAMLIPVAKLMVYTICAGINPLRTLPILLDVGTDNEALLNDPFYLGWRHHRITGSEYDEFIAFFVNAIKKKFPNVLLHWEDFGRDNARRILKNYQSQLCTFNDDIQGTGAVTLAALIAAVKSLGHELPDQRIVIFGGGNAGTGIADQIRDGLMRFGLTQAQAQARIWIIDRTGLLTDNLTELTLGQQPYARPLDEISHWQLAEAGRASFMEVIKHIKPTILIGCSAASGAFTQEIIQELHKHTARPIIFPLSNPTDKVEATPADLIHWTQGQALIASGSPFAPVNFQGREIVIAQCNNALVFPGIGLGAMIVKAKVITDDMLWASCLALNEFSPIHKDPNAPLLPALRNAKGAARQIAIAVAKQAIKNGVAQINDASDIETLVDNYMWSPHYLPFRKK